MIEERSTRLMVALEGRAEALLEALRDARLQREAMSSRLDELERQRQSLEARNAELTAEAREKDAEREALEERAAELERRLADAEASCLELLEENRELDEQNRELEAHNRHLREDREVPAEQGTASFFQRRGRPAQGLSALIGHRHRDHERPPAEAVSNDAEASEPDTTPEPRPRTLRGSRMHCRASRRRHPLRHCSSNGINATRMLSSRGIRGRCRWESTRRSPLASPGPKSWCDARSLVT